MADIDRELVASVSARTQALLETASADGSRARVEELTALRNDVRALDRALGEHLRGASNEEVRRG